RQEVINRLQFTQSLPPGVIPVLSPTSPTGEIYRYTLSALRDPDGQDLYTLNDLKALQDWTLERAFRRVPRVIDVTSAGGTAKRYEVQPDPARLHRYGITLTQFQNALANANTNGGGDVLVQGGNALNVRSLGLYGGGLDPMQAPQVLRAATPADAAAFLRDEEDRRGAGDRHPPRGGGHKDPAPGQEPVGGGPPGGSPAGVRRGGVGRRPS